MIKIPFIKPITPNMEVLSYPRLPEIPQVILIRNFIDDNEIERIMDLARNSEGYRATVVDDDGISEVDTSFRKATLRTLGNKNYRDIEQKLNKLTKWNEFEDFHIIHYKEGEYVKNHLDYHDGLARQRAGTFITYLKPATKGGETVLPELNLRIKPNAGDALFFNYIPNKTVKSTHLSEKILEGEKWILTSFLYEVRYE